MAAFAAGLLRVECDCANRLAAEIRDNLTAIRARPHVTLRGPTTREHGFPVKPQAHTHTPQDEELLSLGRHAQLLAQLEQLDQCIRAVEHPDFGTGHRLLDFSPPLVNQMGWREYQGTTVAFGVEHGGRGDTDGRLAATHLAVDDRGTFATIDQQLGHGMDHVGLRREQSPLEASENKLPVCACLAGVDRWIGTVE